MPLEFQGAALLRVRRRLHEEVADAAVLPADFGGTSQDDGLKFFEHTVRLEAAEDAAAAAGQKPPFFDVHAAVDADGKGAAQ